jgi:Cu-Zn family superoxide dismutase
MRVKTVAVAALALALGQAGLAAQATKKPRPATSAARQSAGIATPQSTVKRAGRVVLRYAHADIKGDRITGTADFEEVKEGTGTVVEITVKASGLKAGLHGVHLHAVGKCDPDFMAAGGHFDPGPASNTDPDANHPFHMGDVPNLLVEANGVGMLHAVTTRVTLSPGPLSIFDADGTAIIIHGNEDKGVTGEPKSGVSGGPRLACGVITETFAPAAK